jgi:hypothetical protein
MGSLGPTYLIALLLAVAIVASIGGFIASAAARRKRRRARGWFVIGFVCGVVAGAKLRRMRFGVNPLAALAINVVGAAKDSARQALPPPLRQALLRPRGPRAPGRAW